MTTWHVVDDWPDGRRVVTWYASEGGHVTASSMFCAAVDFCRFFARKDGAA